MAIGRDVVENTPNQNFVLVLLLTKKNEGNMYGEKTGGGERKNNGKMVQEKSWGEIEGKSHVTSGDVTSGLACARYHFR